jgi:rfaE bifunctional protein kinase chain/domain
MKPSRDQVLACRLLVVGDVMLDRYWHGDVTRISPEAPVPVVHVRTEENRPGGAANVALNARSLGAQVTLLSAVGADAAAQTLRGLLRQHDIHAVLDEAPDMDTIVKLRIIGRHQQMLRIDFEKTPNHEVLARMLDDFERLLPDHDAVLFSDYGKGGLTHIPRMLAMARAMNKPVLVDPKGSDYASYRGATLLTPNRAELMQVVGAWRDEAELTQKAQALRKSLDLQALLLTRSEEGMTLFLGDGSQCSEPARTREVSDVTGAGDTVIATMAVMLCCGMPLDDAMRVANHAGGLVVAKFGTACVSYDELFA